MGRFNDVKFLGGFIYDSVTNSLQNPDSAIPVLEATVQPLTIVAQFTGPRPVFITNLQLVFNDIAVAIRKVALHYAASRSSSP